MTTNVVTAVITAYCACKLCCGPNAKGITANGSIPKQGITIAGSRSLPFGTKVWIHGKNYIIQDRLAKRYDSRLDVYFTRHKDAKQFGIKTQQVTIITER